MSALPLNLTDPFALAVISILVLAVALVLLPRRKPWLSRIRLKPLLTANEVEFFHRLQPALPEPYVFPQVSFAALLTDDGSLSGKSRWAVRARFDRKIADFVICDRETLKVIALVELDDSTHVARADRQRDAITNAAGYRTFRFPSRRKPSQSELAELFQRSRAWMSQ